jgi:uncharacterized membrane protein YdcZ (DUF606 family)
MKRSVFLGLVVALLLHADWHIARPMHHRWSLGLSYHWLITAILFAALGWFVARRWPAERWRLGAQSLILGLIFAQILEPVFVEGLYYHHALEYRIEPERWTALATALVAAVPAYAFTLWRCAKRVTFDSSARTVL